jgi:F-type H+-transporting ATPase subunit gamma
MANARALDKRRKSVKNIRKITRTMELIATARFKKAMDRATASSAYTKRITDVVSDLTKAGAEVKHPLLEQREETKNSVLLVLTGNRGLCGGYNGNVSRLASKTWDAMHEEGSEQFVPNVQLEISGKRGASAFKHRGITPVHFFGQFDDKPGFDEVEVLANRYLEAYMAGKLDRLDVVYTKFISAARQRATIETLLPLGAFESEESAEPASDGATGESSYEFVPSAESILEEVVPTSFKIKLFKCFLDAAVSEQIARMVAMKSATENAGDLIKELSMTYNRARQSQITGEIMEIIGGVEALKG